MLLLLLLLLLCLFVLQLVVGGVKVRMTFIKGLRQHFKGKDKDKVCDSALLVHGIHLSTIRWAWMAKRLAKILAVWDCLITGRLLTPALIKEKEDALEVARRSTGKSQHAVSLADW